MQPANRPNELIIGFHSGSRPDDRGRYLHQIQHWPDERLESVHDFIQWMFPLIERSGVNPKAPVLDPATISEFRARSELQQSLRLSFIRMLEFYGLTISSAPQLRIDRAQQFDTKAENWLHSGNHNHLRITRIIKSLRLLGLDTEAREFFNCLAAIYNDERQKGTARISKETFWFWRSAATDPL